MSDILPETPLVDLNDNAIVDAILNNPAISQMELGSQEMKAALDELNSGKTEEEESADLKEENSEEEDLDEESKEESDEEEDEQEQEHIKSKKPSKGIQKRFDEFTKKIAKLESELKSAKVEEKPVQKAPQEPQFEKEKPKLAQFDSIEDFYEADAEWRFEKAEFQRSIKTEAEQHQAQAQALASKWDERAVNVIKQHPDFNDVVTTEAVQESGAQQPALQYVFKLENGPEVVYKLFSDEIKLNEFKQADAVEQIAILAELKLSLSSSKKSTTKVNNLPVPPRKLPSASGSTPKVYRDDMTDAEFDKILDRELKAQNKRY